MTTTTPTPALADLDLDNAIKLAGTWAAAEHEHARNLGRGGPGQIEKVEKAEAAARAAIEVLARRAAQPVAPVEDVLTIPTAIMDIACDHRLHDEYKRGHRDARHAAADLVLARADELKALAPSPQIAEVAELPPLPAQHEELRARWKCDSCDGRGHDGELHYQGAFQPPEPYPCGDCGGSGYVQIEAYTAEQYRQGQRDAIAASRRAQKEPGK